MGQLEEQIKVVAGFREGIRQGKELKDALFIKWENQHSDLLAHLKGITGSLIGAEEYLRELTLKAYAETGDKTPAKGVGIREVTKLDYDNQEAFDWAKHHEMALKLDTKAFEKIVKADTPSFVTITQEPQATIATRLEIV